MKYDPGKSDQRMLMEYLGLHCKRCGSFDNIEIDHVIPLNFDGADNASNIQFLCKNCHLEKGLEDQRDMRQKHGN